MKRSLLKAVLAAAALFTGIASQAAVTITKQGGWFEAAYAEWTPVSSATNYNVYVKGGQYSSYTQIDKELVRNYSSYIRADVVGLKAGTYTLKVVPVINGSESTADATETSSLTVTAHDRSGFAHYGHTEGIGAYNDDGTLKDNAQVIYVYANNAKTVSATIGGKTYTGFQDIVYGLQKGNSTTPIDIRIIGTIKDSDMDKFLSSKEGLQVKGKSNYAKLNLTIEGIGNDAAIWGFGILVRNAAYCEFRNFAIMLCMDDCLSLDTSNKYVWIHNMDFFYGNTGGDSDQAKGDGTVDVKGKSTNITVSYNHFFDTGKSSLGGMKSETTDCVLTYHHNWFDHSDSRHPRIRTMFFHIYNNYFDGCSKFGVGMTMGGSAFVESNYFRNTKYPMMISKQGTDATGDGTFSGETGGVIVSYNNTIKNAKRYVKWSSSAADDWDAYEATYKTDLPGSSITCASGGTSYNDKLTSTYSYTADAADKVPSIVQGTLGAGRLEHGDFVWQFNNATQDENYGVITALKDELKAYTSSLVGFVDSSLPSAVNNYGTQTRSGGDSEKNANYTPSYGGSDASSDDDDANAETQAYLSASFTTEMGDYYYFNADNDATTTAKLIDKVVTLAGESTSTSGSATKSKYVPTSNDTDANKYGLELVKSTGSAIFYCSTGIPTIAFELYRTGTYKNTVYYSNDGTTWTKIADITVKKGTQTASYSTPATLVSGSEADDNAVYSYPKYVKITNSATGSAFIHGVKIYTIKDGENPITKVATDPTADASATVTIDGENVSGKTFDADATTDVVTVVVTPTQDGATVAAGTGATAAAGATNTWTIEVPSAGNSTTVTFTVTATDGTTTQAYKVTISRASASEDPDTPAESEKIYSWNDNIGTTTFTGSAGETTVNLYKNTTSTAAIKVTSDANDYVTIKPVSGGFKKGDVIYVAGVYSNSQEKVTTITVTTSSESNSTELVGQTGEFINARTSSDEPTSATFTLTTDCDVLYVWRKGKTNTYITTLYVTRSGSATAIDNIDANKVSGDGRMYDLLGRRISQPRHGQMYIMNGRKYIKK